MLRLQLIPHPQQIHVIAPIGTRSSQAMDRIFGLFQSLKLVRQLRLIFSVSGEPH
jgi:hypothetical protein